MGNFARSPIRGRAFVSLLIATAFVWGLALSVSPQLHECVHPDADQPGHSCAVTFISSGNYDHSPQPIVVSPPLAVDPFSQVPTLSPEWVEALFLGASIFEHAPPAFA
jgi:hypothetical protein